MSVTRIVSIHCDGCGEWSYGAGVGRDTATEIRRDLMKRGWVTRRHDSRNIVDLCPDCKSKATT